MHEAFVRWSLTGVVLSPSGTLLRSSMRDQWILTASAEGRQERGGEGGGGSSEESLEGSQVAVKWELQCGGPCSSLLAPYSLATLFFSCSMVADGSTVTVASDLLLYLRLKVSGMVRVSERGCT